MDPEQELERQGWIRMFTVEASRVQEYVELYEQIGMEVLVQTAAVSEMDASCAVCPGAAGDSLKTIFTRPRQKL